MKIKNLLIVFIAFASFTTTYAQSTIMAKAYLKKAEDSYYAGKFEKALEFIKKTKEQLNGKTNPDITYIEAMSHNYFDKNPTKTKVLIENFINEAFEDDDRIEKMASLLIDLNDPEKLCENGDKKRLVSTERLRTGYLVVIETYYNSKSCNLYFKTFFSVNFKKYLEIEDIVINNSYERYNYRYSTEFYEDDGITISSKSHSKNGKRTKLEYFENGKLVSTEEY